MPRMLQLFLALLVCVPFLACSTERPEPASKPIPLNPESLAIPDQGGKKIRGQVLYLPVYSNIPAGSKRKYDVSAFVAIHNTDLNRPISIKKIDFFDTEGKIVRNYITSDQELKPLATRIYTVAKDDQSGTGANFIVEWIAEQQVSEPLIESVMTDLSGNVVMAFLSPGKVVRELK